jgi:hypothetical protein
MRKRLATVPHVYRALFETSLLRDEVHNFGAELAEAEAMRFLSRIDHLEAAALRLVEQFEQQQNTFAH